MAVFSDENRTNVINYNEKSLLKFSGYLNSIHKHYTNNLWINLFR